MFPKIYCLFDSSCAPTVFELDGKRKSRDSSYLCKWKRGRESIQQFLVFTDGSWPEEHSSAEVHIYLNVKKDRKLCTLTKSQRCFLWSADNCKEGYELVGVDEKQIILSASLQGAFTQGHHIVSSESPIPTSTLPTVTTEGEKMQKINETTPVVPVQSTTSPNLKGKKTMDPDPHADKTPNKQLRKKENEKQTPSSENGSSSSRKSKKRLLDKENVTSPSTPKLKSARCKATPRLFGREKGTQSKLILSSSTTTTDTTTASTGSASSNSDTKAVRCIQLPSRVPKPSSRWGHSMCMVDEKTAVLIGGQGNNMQLSKDSIWTLDTESRTWKSSTVTTDGMRPENRTGHSATYDPTMRCIYVFGGSKNSKWFHDVHMYDMDEQKWTLVKVNGKAPTRAYHSATLYRHELWIFGGVFPRPNLQPDGCDNELHIFSPVMEGWYKPIVTGDKPLPRSGHSANVVEDRLLVFGGWDFPFCYNDVHILDLTTLDWSSPKFSGEPPKPRCWAASSTLTNNRVFIHGGYDGDNPLDDAFVFNLDTSTWQTLILDKAPSPRAGHASIRPCSNYESSNEDEIIIFGGGDNDDIFFNDMLSFYVPFVPALSD